jgi:hypothetical protein
MPRSKELAGSGAADKMTDMSDKLQLLGTAANNAHRAAYMARMAAEKEAELAQAVARAEAAEAAAVAAARMMQTRAGRVV